MVDWCGVNDGESEQLAHVSGTVEHFGAAAYCADAAEGFRKGERIRAQFFGKIGFGTPAGTAFVGDGSKLTSLHITHYVTRHKTFFYHTIQKLKQ